MPEQTLSDRATWNSKLLMALCLAWIVIFVFFHAFPVADTAFSSLFCVASDPARDACNLFPARKHWLTDIFRPVFYWSPITALALIIGDIAWQYFRNRWRDGARPRAEILALAGYLVGPIVIVNGILKAHSGRPRPVDTTIFGADLNFVPVGDFSGACLSNCSFVSGEAAAAGWMLCLIPLIHGRFRSAGVALVIGISLAAPFLRVAMGGHFLSDALLGWLIGAASVPALTALLPLLSKGISATLDRVR